MLSKEKFFSEFLNSKELLITSLMILICLILFFIFPVKNYIQGMTAMFFFLFLLPILYIKFVLKKELKEFGLNLENKKEGFIWGLISTFLLVTVFSITYYLTDFKIAHAVPVLIKDSFFIFIFYELVLINILIFILEFFFCGFVFFSFYKYSRYFSIIFLILLFLICFLLTFGFSWQIIFILAISLNSAIIVSKSKSIFYAQASVLLLMIILDSLIIYHLK